LKIISYPHPTLRHKSKSLKRVDAQLKQIVRQMFDLMYEANGVGLAANQVDLPFRLFIANLAASPEEGDELVFINPVVERPKGNDEKDEGCLSIPGVYAPVVRPERVKVSAFDLAGNEFNEEVDGMLARVIQHETDHLDGVLFIDRLSETARLSVEDELAEFERQFDDHRNRNAIPDDAKMAKRLADLESKYC
jgi:peptide deformylase